MTDAPPPAEPAILRWVDATVAKLARLGTATALFGTIDATRHHMAWLRSHQPEHAARVDAAVREAHARLQAATAAGSP